MSEAEKAKQKERRITGLNVNYYLQELADGTVVEVEDIIEFCEMNFAAGCVFKAVWRLCKLRQDLGKPGSTFIYEAEKDLYYSMRNLAIVERRQRRLSRFVRLLQKIKFTLGFFDEFSNPWSIKISISEPKRLTPYSFVARDLMDALGANHRERAVLVYIMTVSLLRIKHHCIQDYREIRYSGYLLEAAKYILEDEKKLEDLRKTNI